VVVTQVAVVLEHMPQPQVVVVQVAGVMALLGAQMVLLEPPIQVAVAVVLAVTEHFLVGQVVLELSSFAILVHNKEQVAQLHLPVDTPITHLLAAAHILDKAHYG
jgi:hypothetical protein